MFNDALGLILADDRKLHLSELTRLRAFAAVPFAGRYRLIDFPLSNMVNSGITRVGIATSYKYKSLMDHLGTGSNWDLDRKNQGLHVLPPYLASENYYNEGDDLKGVQDFLRSSSNQNVVISLANNVFTAEYSEYLQEHIESGADATVLYNNDVPEDGQNFIMKLDQNQKVIDLFLNPEDKQYTANSLGVLFIGRELLNSIIADAISRGIPRLTVDLILRKYDSLAIRAVEYKGTVLRVNSVKSYFKASMDTLDPEVNTAIFWDENLVYTKVKDEAPAYIYEDAEIKNSLVSDGCVVEGKISNSVIFRSVEVGEASVLDNCVVMQGSKIGKNVKLSNVILDKDCVILDNTELQGEKNYPVVIGKGAKV